MKSITLLLSLCACLGPCGLERPSLQRDFVLPTDYAGWVVIEYGVEAGDEDTVLEAAMEAGAEDIESTQDGHTIWTAAEDLHGVSSELEKSLGEAKEVKLAWKPNLTVEMDEKGAGTLLKLIDTLDDDDDVQTVWGNYDISDEVMEKLA